MDTLEFTRGWLGQRDIDYEYDTRTDIVSFFYYGIQLRAFFLQEYALFVLNHSERMLKDSLSMNEADAIIYTLQNSTYTRPVPREDLHKIKFKVVCGQIPNDIGLWLDKVTDDISVAVITYRTFLTNTLTA